MNFFRNLFEGLRDTYPDRIAYYRANTMTRLGILFTALAGLFLVGQLIPGGNSEVVTGLLSIGVGIALVLIFGASVFLVVRGYSTVSRAFMMGLVIVFAAMGIWQFGVLSMAAAYLILMLIISSALFGMRGLWLSFGVALILIVYGVAASGSPLREITGPTGIALSAVILGFFTLNFFSGNLQSVLMESTSSAEQLRIVAEIGQVANESLDSDSLMAQIVDMVRDRMGYYHVQIFLVDDARQNANLVASTGDVGTQLLARGHSLPVGSDSVIGLSTDSGDVVNAADVGFMSVHRKNEFLPDTRSELAVPLLDGQTVIGALDVQSIEANAFPEAVIDTLKIMANQISVAVRNAQLFERLQSTLESNRRLYTESQETLQEVERMNQMLTGQAWGSFLADSQKDYGVRVDAGQVQYQSEWTPALEAAFTSKQVIIEERDTTLLLSVPLDVRGQMLGAIEVEVPASASHMEARETAEAVASRLAMTLDNNRLFEEARNLAEQEHLVNEIGGRLQSTTDVNEMLQIAVQELQQAIGAERGAVRLRSSLDASALETS